MDVVNFPAIINNYGLLDASDIDQKKDLLLIGKKVNDLRDGSQYQEMAMTIAEFLSMGGGGGYPANPTFCTVTLNRVATLGTAVNFVHPDGTGNTVWDTVAPGIEITRSVGGGAIWNRAVEGGYNFTQSPVNTEWAYVPNPLTFNYSTVETLTYSTLSPLVQVTLPCGGFACIPGTSWIMHDLTNDQ